MKTIFPAIFAQLMLLISFGSSFAEEISIEALNANPSQYHYEVVTVSGWASLYIKDGARSTDQYLITDDYGDQVVIMTSVGLPETNKRYSVTGTVIYEASTNRVLINEKTRSNLGVVPPPPPPTVSWWDQNKQMVIIAGLVLLLALLILWYLQSRREEKEIHIEMPENRPMAAPELPFRENPESKEAPLAAVQEKEMETQNFQTLRITTGGPQTLMFIPGQLIITNGPDQGKSFRMQAYPSPMGGIVTIGRKHVNGERRFSHIELLDPTISREQAELILKDSVLRVKNMSKTNFTVVDGVELKPGDTAELSYNSTIRLGALELMYAESN